MAFLETRLDVVGYATAGCPSLDGDQPLPPPGSRGRKARLPELAVAMARAAAPVAAPETAVLFGTAYGCLAETELFVENMIRRDEEAPKPRAFSASVHNAIASRVALALDARGPCRTFVHGAVSFVQALVSLALEPGPALVGALDEATEYVALGRDACGVTAPAGEGGAILAIGAGRPLARIVGVGFARGDEEWIARHARGAELLHPRATRPLTGDHPSAIATATALGVALLAGRIAPAEVGLAAAPARLAIPALSRWGDAGLVVLEGVD